MKMGGKRPARERGARGGRGVGGWWVSVSVSVSVNRAGEWDSSGRGSWLPSSRRSGRGACARVGARGPSRWARRIKDGSRTVAVAVAVAVGYGEHGELGAHGWVVDDACILHCAWPSLVACGCVLLYKGGTRPPWPMAHGPRPMCPRRLARRSSSRFGLPALPLSPALDATLVLACTTAPPCSINRVAPNQPAWHSLLSCIHVVSPTPDAPNPSPRLGLGQSAVSTVIQDAVLVPQSDV